MRFSALVACLVANECALPASGQQFAEACGAAGGFFASEEGTCWVLSNALTEPISSCAGVCESVSMLNMPWTFWMDPLFGTGNEEPLNNEGYKTDLCNTLCPTYVLTDPTGGFGHGQEWAHTVPACEDSEWGKRCYIEDKASMSGLGDERPDRGWSLTSTYAGGRNNEMARLCPCTNPALVEGCTVPAALNYDAGALFDDGKYTSRS